MARFYFDVHDSKEMPDDKGIECADLSEARQEALRTTGEMLRDMMEIWGAEPWGMTVRDESGKTVASITLMAT